VLATRVGGGADATSAGKHGGGGGASGDVQTVVLVDDDGAGVAGDRASDRDGGVLGQAERADGVGPGRNLPGSEFVDRRDRLESRGVDNLNTGPPFAEAGATGVLEAIDETHVVLKE